MSNRKMARQLKAFRNILEEVRNRQQIDITVQLWDGTEVPLADRVTSPLRIIFSGPGVIGAILRRPNIDTLVRLVAKGGIVLEGGTLLDLVDLMPDKAARRKAKRISKRLLIRSALPFITSTDWHASTTREFEGDAETREKAPDINAPPIEFHYSVGNDFYKLFLDSEMQYTCAHFTDWNNSLEQAQRDKMEISCRKLRLQAGESLLDIGCGWGTFACYAAKNFGVKAHGVTLSTKQWEYAQENIKRLGLE
ncbi:MAG: class I SAM-dependent methyltransferase, partial [Fimbriimonadaceae bacterium]|nr:class I SAM-dependent methyltransferase [Alphaproteobacteria bacterium]